jgi:PAS domain S-box-containing protein
LNKIFNTSNLPGFQQIVEASQLGMWMIDENDYTNFVNTKMCEILQYGSEELIGKKMIFFMNDDSVRKSFKRNERGRLGISDMYEAEFIAKSGKQIYVSISASPVFNNTGTYIGSLAIMTDLTKKKKTEREAAWLINNIDEYFIFLNADFEIISFNKQFQKLCTLYRGITLERGRCLIDYAPAKSRDTLRETCKKALRGSEQLTEMFLPLADGNQKNIAVTYKPAKDEEEQIIGVFISITDISEKKKSQQQLLITESKFRALVETGSDAVVILSAEGKPLYISPTLEKVLGYTEAEALQLGVFSMFHPDYIEWAVGVWQQVLNSPGVPIYAKPSLMMHKDGKWRWLEGTLTNLLHDSAVNGIVDNFRDVTEKVTLEEQREFERRDKEALINTTEDMMWTVNSDFTLRAANRAFINVLQKSTGVSLKTGDRLVEDSMNPAEFLKLWKNYYNKALKGESFIEETYNPSWGEIPESWAETRFDPIYENGIITGIACYSRDTTAARHFKNELLDINKKLGTAQRAAHMGYWELSMDRGRLYWSDEVYRIWGVSPDTYQPGYQNFDNSLHPDDREAYVAFEKLALEGKCKLDAEHRIILPDGTIKHIQERGELVYDADGKPLRFEGTAQDITKMKQDEDALIKQEGQLTLAAQLAKLGYWEFDIQNDLFIFNDQFYALFKTTAEKVGGYTMSSARYAELFIHPDDRKLIERSMEEAVKSSDPYFSYKTEHRIMYATGEMGYISVQLFIVKDEQNRVIKNFGVNQDITERKEAEFKIKENELRYRTLVEQATDAICIADASMKFIDVNPYTCQISGYSREEFLQLKVADLLVEEEIKVNPLRIGEVKIGKMLINERMLRRKNGTTVIMEVSTQMMEGGGFLFFGHDITRRKKAEEEIKESNLRFEYLTRATSDAIWDWDLITDTIYLGEGFETVFGYNIEEFKKDLSSLTSRIHPEEKDRIMVDIRQFINGGAVKWEEQYRFLKSDNSWAFVINKAVAIRDENGKALRLVGGMRDISKRKMAEIALRQSEARLQGIIDSQTNYVIRTDLEGKYTYYNQKFFDDFGWIHDQESLMGLSGMVSIIPSHHQVFKVTVEKCFDEMNKVFQVEIDKPARNGAVKTTIWDFICLTDSEGKPTEIQCVGIDISERKRAEHAYIESIKEKNTILESITDGFFAVDKNWTVTYWNNQAASMLHKPKENMLRQRLWDHFSTESVAYAKYHQSVEINQPIHFEDYYSALSKWYGISSYPSENGLSVYFKDITEQKQSEINLKRLNANIEKNAKELAISNAELEQFAYIASHDLQEPLRMITSYLSQIEIKYEGIIDEKGKRYIHFAVDGARRMRQIILDLLEYSRVGRTGGKDENIDLNEIIGEILVLFKKQIAEKNAVITFDTLPVVLAHPTPMRQVFQNLLSNALKYSTEDTPVKIHISVKEQKEHWQFAIKDNGIGIAKEYYDKIFIIFQRLHNKEEFSGTGLGLAVTKKIIETMGGKIWVKSTEEKGSTFYFTILKLGKVPD